MADNEPAQLDTGPYSLGSGYVRMSRCGGDQYCYLGPEGIVSIYRQPPNGNSKSMFCKGYTALDFVHEGKLYSRSFYREYHSRWLARICRQFIKDVWEAKQ